MKTKLPWLLIGLTLFANLAQTGRTAVAFTITPSVVSNSYSGPITLQITGLASGDTVVVQKFLDANANGVVDAGDILWQQFNMTDGTNFVFGGVTNNNVPGDTDGTANGQITAKLNFQSDFSQTIVGQYLFELSSPSNHFTAVTNSFTVTNFPYAQQFTGTVVSNGVAVPNAAILLFPSSGPNGNNNPIGGTVANNSGIYALRALAGNYSLIPFKTGFVANFATAPVFTLSNNATFNTNLSLLPATESISGKFVDASNSSLGLPGLLVPVQTQNKSLLGIGFTDTNGNFILGVSSNHWGISSLSAGLALHGYVGLQNKTAVDTTTGSVSGVTIALPKATAFFYGSVKDNFGNPWPGEVAIEAYDNNNNLYQSDGYTDTNGNYVVAALGGLGSNAPWQVGVDNSSSFPTDIFSQPAFDQNGGDNIKAGKAVLANITGLLATNTISGNVETNGHPIIGVGVSASATIGGAYYNLNNVDTGANGNYLLNVGAGNWTVNVYDCGCSDNDSLNNILAGENYQVPNSQNVTISNNIATGVDFVVQMSGSDQIFGYVTDGLGDAIVGVNVYANDGPGDIYTNSTDDTGYYSFNLADGNWDISVDCGQLSGQGYPCVNDQEVSVCCGNSEEADFVACDQPLQITTTNLPTGMVNVAYDQFLQASSCNASFNWSLNSGALPPGLQLAATGELSGTATNGGTFNFTVSVTDGNNNTTNQMLSLAVIGGTPQIITTSLPRGTNGLFYRQQLQAAYGQSPYTWSLALGSAGLPASLVLATNGVISGTPDLSGTNFEFIVQVTDANTNSAQELLALTIVGSSIVPVVGLTTPNMESGQFEFTFNTVYGVNYTIQYCTTLGNWIDLMTLGGSGGALTIIDPNPAGSGERFYRVKTGP